MAGIYRRMEELIGNTPLLELEELAIQQGCVGRILAKLEMFNPGGSVKDRVARSILDTAQQEGKLSRDSVIIEPTSGNTGIGLAAVAASRGMRAIIVMPDTMSMERRILVSAYGAELVLTEGRLGMAGAIEKAEELLQQIPNSLLAGQFINPANPQAHYLTTGPEIWRDTDGKVDCFVAGIGTGGTITGTGRYLKEKNPRLHVVGVEPAASAVLSGGKKGAHGLQGIGAGFIPEILDTDIYDELSCVTEAQAYEAARLLGKSTGLLVGISSGAALHTAIELAKRAEYRSKNIVVLLPDGADRYYSTPLFAK